MRSLHITQILVVSIVLLSPKFSFASEECNHLKISKDTAICTLFPESTEGPYYLPDQKERQNITEGKPGLPLRLHLTVVNFTTCQPLGKVAVDLWQCDALGDYSSVQKGKDDKTFLRGVQHTDGKGQVVFDTIFPGWYPARTVHIHVDAWVNQKKHTGQFFFSEKLTGMVAGSFPYNSSTIKRQKNDEDRIYLDSYGNNTLLTPSFTVSGIEASLLMGFVK